MTVVSSFPARARIDLAALAANTRNLVTRANGAAVMAVVKADAYGHGLIPVSRAALDAGATWLGVCQVSEALAVREAGIDARVLAWIYGPDTQLDEVVAAQVDLAAYAPWGIELINDAARRVGTRARVHLKVDTGLSRGGARPGADLDALIAAAQSATHVDPIGLWTHYSMADDPGHPAIAEQDEVFADAIAHAERAGLDLEVRHIANSAGTLTKPETFYDMVRPGIAIYGVTPMPQLDDDFGLVPVMTLEAELILTKNVGVGQGVSYGLTYHTSQPTRLGLIPLGYGDGIPRHASNRAPVKVGDRQVRIAGRICMDQFVVDLGPDATEQAGDLVTLFGPGTAGEPTAQDWAEAADTIAYEIVTRVGPRVPREYVS